VLGKTIGERLIRVMVMTSALWALSVLIAHSGSSSARIALTLSGIVLLVGQLALIRRRMLTHLRAMSGRIATSTRRPAAT
jgi:hypothetical protein